MLKTGDRALDFELQNTNGEKKSLKDLNNKQGLVLLFFPLAFSSTCTSELCNVRDNMKVYESLNATITAISVDSFFCLKAFKKANNYKFELLSDFNTEVSKNYDVLYDDFYGMKGVSKRAAFIIDSKGIIQYAEVLEDSSKVPDMSAIQGVLEGL